MTVVVLIMVTTVEADISTRIRPSAVATATRESLINAADTGP